MGIENIRFRWPNSLFLAICVIFLISFINSWKTESELRLEVLDLSNKLKECITQQFSCQQAKNDLAEQVQRTDTKLTDLNEEKSSLNQDLHQTYKRISNIELQLNNSKVEANNCKLEVQSLESLKITYTATLDAIRLKEDELTKKLKESFKTIKDLEEKIERMNLERSEKHISVSAKVTPEEVNKSTYIPNVIAPANKHPNPPADAPAQAKENASAKKHASDNKQSLVDDPTADKFALFERPLEDAALEDEDDNDNSNLAKRELEDIKKIDIDDPKI